MKLTDDRNGLKITKSKCFCAIKGDTCDFFNRRTVANIRRTEHAVMDCPQCECSIPSVSNTVTLKEDLKGLPGWD